MAKTNVIFRYCDALWRILSLSLGVKFLLKLLSRKFDLEAMSLRTRVGIRCTIGLDKMQHTQ